MGVYTYTLGALTLTVTAEIYFGDIVVAGALLIAAAIVALMLMRRSLRHLLKALWIRFGHKKQFTSLSLPPVE
jgi:hypothetical protein